MQIGVIYGSPEVTSGGLALKYFCSIRIDVRRIEVLKSAKEDIGIRVKAKVKHWQHFHQLLDKA